MSSAPLGPRSPAALQVFAWCAPFVVAVAADLVERLLLPEDVRLIDPAGEPRLPGSLGVLAVTGRHYAAWDLGALLGLRPQEDAFVLFRSPADPAYPPLALRTGPCLSVAPLRGASVAELAASVFRSRRGALTAAFGAAGFRGGREDVALVGLTLDPARLWTEVELEHARATLRAAAAEAS